uniref:Disease resistance protein Roq1-like winged-helix domain-containing protein n=1 Tax=Kalanchoe fedtschenkoi TaxID=63787 RepID=A0A7N0VK66_KALFE
MILSNTQFHKMFDCPDWFFAGTLEVMASSLRSINFNMWKSQYERRQDYLDAKVFNVLSWSFDSLHDTVKDIFLHIAFYMIGRNRGYALKILDGCGLHGEIGLEDLIGKCLMSVDEYHDTLSMHHLIQQMGHEVVRQKPPIELGCRCRISGEKDAYKVLLNIKKKSAVKGLHLDNSDPYDDDISSNEMYVGNTAKHMRTTYIRPINFSGQDLERPKPIKTSAFTEMENLDLLLLENVELYGSFDDFPKGIKWLLWKGCALKEIPLDYELDELVALDMQKSCLVHVWNGLKKILPNVKGCINLVTLPESIRNLKKLTCVIVDDCRNLKNLPINIGSVLYLDGC